MTTKKLTVAKAKALETYTLLIPKVSCPRLKASLTANRKKLERETCV